jgi:hypothetical protein
MSLSIRVATVALGVAAAFGTTAGLLFGGDDPPPDLGDPLVLQSTPSPAARPSEAEHTDPRPTVSTVVPTAVPALPIPRPTADRDDDGDERGTGDTGDEMDSGGPRGDDDDDDDRSDDDAGEDEDDGGDG